MPKRDRAAYMKGYRERKRQEVATANIAELAASPARNAGELAAAWATANLRVPSGPLRGQPFQIDGWQRDFLVDALAPGVREAGCRWQGRMARAG